MKDKYAMRVKCTKCFVEQTAIAYHMAKVKCVSCNKRFMLVWTNTFEKYKPVTFKGPS